MFKLIFEKNGAFVIRDTDDNSIDTVLATDIAKYLAVGLEIGGITPNADFTDFTYTDEFFEIPAGTDIDEDEDEDVEIIEEDYDEDTWDYIDEEDTEEETEEVEEVEEEIEEPEYTDTQTSADDYDTEVIEEVEEVEDEDWEEDNSTVVEEETEYDEEDYEEDYEYEDEDESKITKFYKWIVENFNANCKDLLQRYYLYTSQILFQGAPSRVMNTTNNTQRAKDKQQKLDSLRQSGRNWVYAGFVDLEYRGANFCTFGHSLRYLHFAWDAGTVDLDAGIDGYLEQTFWGIDYASINWDVINQLIEQGSIIKFGIDCIGDFFDVDKETLDSIKRVQRESISEMEEMFDIYLDPVAYANARASFGVFESIADRLIKDNAVRRLTGIGNQSNNSSKTFMPDVPVGILSLYKEFKDAGMIYPRSLVKRVQDAFLSRMSHNLSTARFLSNGVFYEALGYYQKATKADLSYVLSTKGSSVGLPTVSFARRYFENLLQIQFAGIYAYNPYSAKVRDVDEGGRNKTSRTLYHAITGVTDYDKVAVQDIMSNYRGYPACFNQINGMSDVVTVSDIGIQFTPEYASLVNKFVEITATHKRVVSLEEWEDKFPCIVVCEDGNVPDNAVSILATDIPEYSQKYGVTRFSGTKYQAIYDVRSTISVYANKHFIDYYTLRRSSYRIGNSDDCFCATLEELCEKLQSNIDTIRDLASRAYDEYVSNLRQQIVEENIKNKARYEESQKEVNALKQLWSEREKDLLEDQVESQVENHSLSNTDKDNEGIYKDCIEKVKVAGVLNAVFTTEEILACYKYALTRENLKQGLDDCDTMILKVADTLSKNGRQPSSRQLYYLKKGMQLMFKEYDEQYVEPEPTVYTELAKDADLRSIIAQLTKRAGELRNMYNGKVFYAYVSRINRINRDGKVSEDDMKILNPVINRLGIKPQ